MVKTANANVDSAWGQYTYQIPAAFQVPSTHGLPHFHLDGHNCLWRIYRDARDKDIPERPSTSVMAACEFARLMQLVHETTILYYDGHEGKVKAYGVLKQYRKYLQWMEEMTDDLAITDVDDKTAPHTLSLQYVSSNPLCHQVRADMLSIQYYAALVHLFRPLLYLGTLPKGTRDHLRALTVDFAWQGLEIQRRYQRLFTCRYQSWGQNFSLLHFCDTLLRFALSEVDGTEIVHFCLEALKESADGRGGAAVCGPLQEMFRRCAVECGVKLPDNLDDLMGSEQYGPDQLLDACTRLTYAQPVDQIVANIDEDLARTFAEEWNNFMRGSSDDESERSEVATALSEKSMGERYMTINSLLNG